MGDSVADDAADGFLGRVLNTDDALAAAQFGCADKFGTLDRMDAVEVLAVLCARVVGFPPQWLINFVEDIRLARPVNHAADEFIRKGFLLGFIEQVPRFVVDRTVLVEVGALIIPHGAVRFLGLSECGTDAFCLFSEEFHGGNFKSRTHFTERGIL
ncbi:hypothetical protein SDC9_194052 [bioreactor metagenome]|uniref:Uncharacterized protein n=1 Tax=bioreactor metagenome TaxID=1076179 RepID=A0A645I6E6_9ZZZZ